MMALEVWSFAHTLYCHHILGEDEGMSCNRRMRALISLCCVLASRAWAGGSGLNVVVVVNQNSANSVQLGNYYCEKRQVPPQNYLRINWLGDNIAWVNSDFQTFLYNPLVSMLATNKLTNQIDYVLLSMDIPYHVFKTIGDDTNSTTSALFYGFHTNDPNQVPSLPSCSLPAGTSNSYSGSEGIFRST